MLTAEENALLTQIGPGSRMGELLRRYWQIVGAVDDLRERWTKRVRIFGEDLVLFKDRSGRFGLIGEQCPHRRASMAYGIPAIDGLRCPYHGWKFDATGACLEQPNEPEGSTFKDKVSLPGYPVQEMGGILWAYLGPQPAPLIPRYDGYVTEGTIRVMGHAVIPCNWLQIMENSVDIIHTEWLHGKLYEFVKENDGIKVAISRRHLKYDFKEEAIGIRKYRLLEGSSEDGDDWKIGHPLVFPTSLITGNAAENWHEYRFQIRVPMDDENTMFYWWTAFVPPAGVTPPPHLLDRVHTYETPLYDEKGEFLLDSIHGQDAMAWIMQGKIVDRTREALGVSDRGLTMYRRMLLRELKRVEAGEDPKGVIRDPADNGTIEVPVEAIKAQRVDGFEAMFRRHQIRYAPVAMEVLRLFVPESTGELTAI
jgi:5,5'-dehydrodivanillate O-demethylase